MKITDTLTHEESGSRSRMELWWRKKEFKLLYKGFRGGSVPDAFMNKIKDVRKVEEVFKLKGFQYGNWLTNGDRFNYLAALGICLYDLNKVLKFKNNNLGFDGNLGVAFGARGVRGAMAHYEASRHLINMTRYHEAERYDTNPSKETLFVNTGGAGAFAHEYGHFLDYFIGQNIKTHPTIYTLTNWRSTSQRRIKYDPKKYPARAIVENILMLAYWSEEGKKDSNFIIRVKRFGVKAYWFRRNEIFARLFEQYIGYKLKQIGIENSFLTHNKYAKQVYMTQAELKKVVPLFDELLIHIRMAF